MKKGNMLKVKWRARRISTLIAIYSIIGYAMILYFFIWFSTIPDRKDVWFMASIVGTSIYFTIVLFTYICVIRKAKKTRNYIYWQKRLCKKGRKRIQYDDWFYTQTLIQKIFGLVTVEFINTSDKLILKDVSKKILDYLPGKSK